MRSLALLGFLGCLACTRMNPSFGDGGGTGDGDGGDDGQSSLDDSPTDATITASTSASDDAVTDSIDGSDTQDGSASDPTVDGTGGLHHCCRTHNGPGCDDPAIEACVCEKREKCCIEDWNDECVANANECAAGCSAGDTGVVEEGSSTANATGETSDGATSSTSTDGGGSTTGGLDDCCAVQIEAGCSNPATQACVCAIEGLETCCGEIWGMDCVDAAFMQCPGACVA